MRPRNADHRARPQDGKPPAGSDHSGGRAAALPPDQIQRLRTVEEWLVGFSRCHRSANPTAAGRGMS
ncbi:MAG TPA: hypothetical protein VII47_00895 [Actinomycetota bacterium]|jgi:hypothetical protein